MSLSETAQLLFDQYGSVTLTSDQLAEVLHYKSTRVLLNAVSADRCPIRTFRMGKLRVADIRDVADFIDQRGEP